MARHSPGRIFISYRREETAWPARTLYAQLVDTFGANQVFKDVDNIEPGDDFVERITEAVTACDILLALIGPHWLSMADETGARRLDNPDDFVRIEIAVALNRGVRVVPILVDGARMPRSSELPAELQGLTRRQAVEINPVGFSTDRLLATITETLAGLRAGKPTEATGQTSPPELTATDQARIAAPARAPADRPIPSGDPVAPRVDPATPRVDPITPRADPPVTPRLDRSGTPPGPVPPRVEPVMPSAGSWRPPGQQAGPAAPVPPGWSSPPLPQQRSGPAGQVPSGWGPPSRTSPTPGPAAAQPLAWRPPTSASGVPGATYGAPGGPPTGPPGWSPAAPPKSAGGRRGLIIGAVIAALVVLGIGIALLAQGTLVTSPSVSPSVINPSLATPSASESATPSPSVTAGECLDELSARQCRLAKDLGAFYLVVETCRPHAELADKDGISCDPADSASIKGAAKVIVARAANKTELESGVDQFFQEAGVKPGADWLTPPARTTWFYRSDPKTTIGTLASANVKSKGESWVAWTYNKQLIYAQISSVGGNAKNLIEWWSR